MKRQAIFAAALAAATADSAFGQAHEHHEAGHGAADAAAAACSRAAAGPSVHCGAAPTVAFAPDGRLWAAFEQNGTVYVTASDDLGSSYTAPVAVNPVPETVDINGENRTKIAFGGKHTADGQTADGQAPDGHEASTTAIYVSWTHKLAGGYNGEIRFSRSLDGGRHFEAPRTINDDGLVTGHRFETLFVDSRGNVYLSWLDKRDLVAAESRGTEYVGAAVYYTVSRDGGKTFAPNRKVADHSCECCRIAAAETPHGDVALFFREVFDAHIRDHGFAAVGPEGVVRPLVRATHDGWRIDACPHHGPAMVSAGDGRYDLAWFTGGDAHKGIYYGRFDPTVGAAGAAHAGDTGNAADTAGASGGLTQVLQAAASPQAGHPSLNRLDGRLRLAWKEFDGERTAVYLIESTDDGATWSERRVIAVTAGASDHPFLVDDGMRAFLSWRTAAEGLRILPLPAILPRPAAATVEEAAEETAAEVAGKVTEKVAENVVGDVVGEVVEAPSHFVAGSLAAIEHAHAGQPFIVSVWSTDCAPCRDDLELLGRFHKAHPDVPVVLIASDGIENASAVRDVLGVYALAGVESWIFADPNAERLRYSIDPSWFGEMPRAYFYDSGLHRTAVSGSLTKARLEAWLETAKPAER